MPATNEAFWGQRLQTAREFRGLTQKELGASVAASDALISLCENGKKKEPARDLIEACAEVLGFAPAFFYGPLEDIFREEECSFRHRRSAPERLKTQVRAHGTLLGLVVEQLRWLFRFPRLDVPRIPAVRPEEIELAAERCRQHWGLGVERPIMQVGRVLERAGVILAPHVVRTKKVDAFSRNGPTAIIFLNQAIQSPSRWNFDIAHECGHLVMHSETRTGSTETEMAADRFASAFLMPRLAFVQEFSMMGAFSWDFVFNLKRRWQTSAQAIVRRAYDLGLLGAVGYRRAYKHISSMGWRSGPEPSEPEFQPPELLSTALTSLGQGGMPVTLGGLCMRLHFRPATFEEVTGVKIPSPKCADRVPSTWAN